MTPFSLSSLSFSFPPSLCFSHFVHPSPPPSPYFSLLSSHTTRIKLPRRKQLLDSPQCPLLRLSLPPSYRTPHPPECWGLRASLGMQFQCTQCSVHQVWHLTTHTNLFNLFVASLPLLPLPPPSPCNHLSHTLMHTRRPWWKSGACETRASQPCSSRTGRLPS